MRKSLLFLVVLAFMASALASTAFAAGEVQLQVNGDRVPSPALYLDNDVTMIPAATFASLAGADFTEAGDVFTITENGKTLALTNGKKEAMLGEQPVALPCATVKTENVVYIPLRAVSSAFGFEVGWDAEKRLVSLDRQETRDGLTPLELLTKSNAACQAFNTYSMDGSYDMDIDIKGDGKPTTDSPAKMAMSMSGQIQSEPMQIYMVQKVIADEAAQIPEMVIETYMDEEKIYMKMPEQEWQAMDLPISPAFIEQQQDIQNDPLKAIEQMKEMGILLNYGNDISLDGKDYYVVNASLDMDKFMENFQGMFQQVMQAAAASMAENPAELQEGDTQADTSSEPEENAAEIQEQMQQLMENIQMDYYYTTLINKETLVSDILKFNIKMAMTMEHPDPDSVQSEEQAPQEISIDMDMNGEFLISGLGEPFKAPVIVDNNVKTPAN